MNEAALLQRAYEEAVAAQRGDRPVLVELRCGLSGHDVRAPVVGTVYATAVGELVVAITSLKATNAKQPGRIGMGLATDDSLPRYWMVSAAGPVGLAHPSPLSTPSPPALVKIGSRPVKVQCPTHRRWLDCPFELLTATIRKAKSTTRQTLMMPV